MTILITGGAGFIGSHLCEFYTSRGTPVVALDDLSSGRESNFIHPDRVTLVKGDVADRALVARLVADADMVFHLAAIASVTRCAEEPAVAESVNMGGTEAVFAAVAAVQRQMGRIIPVAYASSAAIYGDNPNIPLSEAETPAPINRYGEHKLANERTAAAYSKQGVRSAGLRFFNVYGARQDPSSPYSGVISRFIDRVSSGQGVTIFGDGEQTRDFIYVKDVVGVLVNAAARAREITGDQAAAAIFNVCTGTATNLKSLAHTIGRLRQQSQVAVTRQEPRAGDIRHSLGDPRAVMAAFGITQWTPLSHGLSETLAPHV